MKKVEEILSHYGGFINREVYSAVRPILEHVLGRSLNNFFIKDISLDDEESKLVTEYLDRFISGVPLSKIINKANFYGNDFFVNEHVLDPRCDSEILVEAVLEKFEGSSKFTILDLGVGSGCLLLSILKERVGGLGVGCDVSAEAIKISKKNAKALALQDRVEFFKSDWFSGISSTQFDLIISNPPYIRTSDIKNLDHTVKDYDPILALDGGEDGLKAYRKIFTEVGNFLKPGAQIFVEIGYGQSDGVTSIARKSSFSLVESRKDMSGVTRVLQFTSIL